MGRNQAGWVLCVLFAAAGCAGDGNSTRRVPWDRTVFQESPQLRPPADPFPRQGVIEKVFPALSRPQFEPLGSPAARPSTAEAEVPQLGRTNLGRRTAALSPADYQIADELEKPEPARRLPTARTRSQLAARPSRERSSPGPEPDDDAVIRTQNNSLNEDEDDSSALRRIPRLPVPIVVNVDPELIQGRQGRPARLEPEPIIEESPPGLITGGSVTPRTPAAAPGRVPVSAPSPARAQAATAPLGRRVSNSGSDIPDWVRARKYPETVADSATSNSVSQTGVPPLNYPLSVRRSGPSLSQPDEPTVSRASSRLARGNAGSEDSEVPPLDLGPPAQEAETVQVPSRIPAQVAARPVSVPPRAGTVRSAPREVELFPGRPSPEVVNQEVAARMAEAGIESNPLVREELISETPAEPPVKAADPVEVEVVASDIPALVETVDQAASHVAQTLNEANSVLSQAESQAVVEVQTVTEEKIAANRFNADQARQAIETATNDVPSALQPVIEAIDGDQTPPQTAQVKPEVIEKTTDAVAKEAEAVARVVTESVPEIAELPTPEATPIAEMASGSGVQVLTQEEPSTPVLDRQSPPSEPVEVADHPQPESEPLMAASSPVETVVRPSDEPPAESEPVAEIAPQHKDATSGPVQAESNAAIDPRDLLTSTTELWPGAGAGQESASLVPPVALPEADPEMSLVPTEVATGLASTPETEDRMEEQPAHASEPAHTHVPGTYRQPRKAAWNPIRGLFTEPFKQIGVATAAARNQLVAPAALAESRGVAERTPNPVVDRTPNAESERTTSAVAERESTEVPPVPEMPRGRPRMPLVRAWRRDLSADLPPIEFPEGYYDQSQVAGASTKRLAARDPQSVPARATTGTPADSQGRAKGPGLFRRWRERWEAGAERTASEPAKLEPSDPIITR